MQPDRPGDRRPPARRALRVAIAAGLGLVLGAGAYLAYSLLTPPGPRPAPGWSLLASMPEPRGETASAVVGGLVYVAGGFQGLGFETSATVSVYDVARDAWLQGPPLPAPRNHAAAAELVGVLYVSGGAEAPGGATDTLWALGSSGAWGALPLMPEARSGHRMVAAAGRLYVIGGVGGPATGPGATGRVLIFDPAANAWSEGAAMEPNRDHLAAVLSGARSGRSAAAPAGALTRPSTSTTPRRIAGAKARRCRRAPAAPRRPSSMA